MSVTPTAGLSTTEAGGSDSFEVVLDTEPTATVSIGISTSDASEGLVASGVQGPASSITLDFDALNWSVPQTVEVTGQADPDCAGIDPADVSATNLDDEVPAGVEVTSVTPDSMNAGGSIAVTIAGTGFQAGAVVSFENGSGPAPSATNVVFVDGNTLTATFGLQQGAEGSAHVGRARDPS